MTQPITTAYCRYDGDYPANGFDAIKGFNTIGIKVIPFYGFGDIETEVNCNKTALVHGYVGDIQKALIKLNIPIPKPLDYPIELNSYLGRNIKEGFLGEIRDRKFLDGIFIKPKELKVFTGFVYCGNTDRLRICTYPDETPIYYSDIVNFISEYRCFVLDGEIIDVRRYKGDWSKAPNRDIIESAIRDYKSTPMAYCIDFGITSDNQTLLVEANDGFSFGSYGLHSTMYAKMLEARWEELTKYI